MKSRKRLNRIYPVHGFATPRGSAVAKGFRLRQRLRRDKMAGQARLFTRFMLLKSRCFQVTAFSFKLSSIPGPEGQVCWKDINFIGEYHEPT
jgi:hypothetical protein